MSESSLDVLESPITPLQMTDDLANPLVLLQVLSENGNDEGFVDLVGPKFTNVSHIPQITSMDDEIVNNNTVFFKFRFNARFSITLCSCSC